MSSEQTKGRVELAVFGEFASRVGLPVDHGSIDKHGAQSEPDIYCRLLDGEQVAFELVEICAAEIAAALDHIRKGGVPADEPVNDPTGKIIKKKLGKQYKTHRPIELLCYTAARAASTDDQILAELRHWLVRMQGPFRRVWLLGEQGVHLVWTDDARASRLAVREGV